MTSPLWSYLYNSKGQILYIHHMHKIHSIISVYCVHVIIIIYTFAKNLKFLFSHHLNPKDYMIWFRQL
jgi:hypothetical protein